MKNLINKYLVLLPFFIILLAACSKTSPEDLVKKQTEEKEKQEEQKTEKEVDVYIAGYIKENYTPGSYQNITAAYWKNGKEVRLLGGGGGSESYAESIIVSGNDVYVLGWVPVGWSYNLVLWENGRANILTKINSPILYPNSLFVHGNDVYVVAFEGTTEIGYWQNGNRVVLKQYDYSSYNLPHMAYTAPHYAAVIAVSEKGDVYVAGHVNHWNYNDHDLVYWKNSEPHLLELPAGGTGNMSSYITSICVSGDDVYIGGSYYNSSGKSGVYWKNGKAVDMPQAEDIQTITISGDDVYIVGKPKRSGTTNKYWKNGIEGVIETPPSYSYWNGPFLYHAQHLFVLRNNVYMIDEVDGNIYYKNGKQVEMVDKGNHTYTSIFVVEK